MASEPFASLLNRAHSHASDYLQRLPERHVDASASREELMDALRTPLPQRGEDGVAVLDLLAAQAERGTSACVSPRYFGFVIGGSFARRVASE